MTQARRGRATRRTVVLTMVVVLLGLVGVAAGIVVDRERGPQWSADTGVLIRYTSPETVLVTGLAADVGAEDLVDAAAVAKSEPVLTRAAAKLGSPSSWTALADQVSVDPVGSSHIIKITAKAKDRDSATRTADAVATAYVETLQGAVRAEMATLETLPRPPDPQRQGGSDVTADMRSRAVALGREITIAETFHTSEPVQVVPGFKTPAALGVVGLAAGALAVVVLTLLRPAASGRGAHAGGTGQQRRLEDVYRPATTNGHRPATSNGHHPAETADPVRT